MFECVIPCFFNDTATTEIYTYGHTLSLHDALPIYGPLSRKSCSSPMDSRRGWLSLAFLRSEEHTSELQSLMRISYAVFCLKNKKSHTDKSITTFIYIRSFMMRYFYYDYVSLAAETKYAHSEVDQL